MSCYVRYTLRGHLISIKDGRRRTSRTLRHRTKDAMHCLMRPLWIPPAVLHASARNVVRRCRRVIRAFASNAGMRSAQRQRYRRHRHQVRDV